MTKEQGELKPCPFCGSPAELRTSRIPYSTAVRIKCEGCGIEITRQGNDLQEGPTTTSAVAAWNRRALPEPAHGSSEPVTDGRCQSEWLNSALCLLDSAAVALRLHHDEYGAQQTEAGAHAIRMGSSALADQAPSPSGSREMIARIIDPELWATWDRMNSDPAYERPTWTANTSLAKADAILAALSIEGPVGREGSS